MSAPITELRIVLRRYLGARGFTAVAVPTLALGIALNATSLAVVNAYLFKALPYPESSRLHSIRYVPPDWNPPRGFHSLDWGALRDMVEHPIAWDLDMFYLVGGEHPERAPGAWVTPGFMEGLGVRAAIGRSFSSEDFDPGSPQVALIADRLWRGRFGGDPAVVGRRFDAYVSDRPEEAETFTVVGVLPAGFWHVNPYTQVLVPLRVPTHPYMVRLREGVAPADVESRVAALVRHGIPDLPAGWRVAVRSVHGEYVARVRPVLSAVAGAAALVLLIACANVAFLLLVRATRREKEIALRMALGAGRGRIARLLALEGLVLGGAATAVGLALTWIALRWLPPIVQRLLERPAPGGDSAIAVDGFVLGAALLCCAATTSTFALAPLLASWRTSLSRAMQSGGRGAEGRGSRRIRSMLIAVEVAGSLTLLVGCGLMVRSVARLVAVDLGYRTERVLAASLALRERSHPTDEARSAFYARLLPRLSGVPGVEAAGLASWPAVFPPRPQPIEADGASGPSRLEAGVVAVSPGYFATLGVPLAEGRDFTLADRLGAEPVALVSRTLADRLWPGRSAVGARLRASGRDAASPWRTVVGVVRDVRQAPTDEDPADMYVPLLQAPGRFAPLYARASGPPLAALPALRRVLKEIDPEASLDVTGVLSEIAEERLARPRFLAGLLLTFAALAAALALLGTYGVIAYAVRQREHEIAVRMAVGADARAVTALFVRQGARILGAGVAAGLCGATLIGRALEAQMFGVQPADPSTLILASAAFVIAGLVAVWWPARRAASTDPALALRQE
jgi:putative ABC transport system permease protein